VLHNPSENSFLDRISFGVEGIVMNYKKFSGAANAALMIIIATMLLAPGAWAQSKYKTLYRFKGGKDGNAPVVGLVFESSGNLYGTTNYGGAHNAGTVFELTPTSTGGWRESVLYSFTGGKDGADVAPTLVLDGAGNIYGTAGGGGAYGHGVVFELTPTSSGWTEAVLYSFTGGSDGAAPFAGVILDSTGNLYGTTWNGGSNNCGDGCGVVFKLTPNQEGWTESVLYSWQGVPDLENSNSNLIFDNAGNLYGATWYGDSFNCGGVFELTPNADGTWTEHVLYGFKCGKDGSHPSEARLIFDSARNLYGTAGNQYDSHYGVVFTLVHNSDGTWTKHTLHEFKGGKDGANPHGGLTFDSAGNLYGDTRYGGVNGYGVVFKLTPTSTGGWTYRVLHPFVDKPAAYPQGDLIVDGLGNLYGTTAGDGSTTFGSVFEITP
jgi:uncharacterized repeat protein (TIGR03803 family)